MDELITEIIDFTTKLFSEEAADHQDNSNGKRTKIYNNKK